MRIVPVSGSDVDVVAGLAELTLGCVEDGDSIGWLAGVTHDELTVWWRELLSDPHVVTWCALEDVPEDVPEDAPTDPPRPGSATLVAGTVSLRDDAPPTGRHRAEVTKLLVHRDRRRRGIAAALMATLEAEAAARGLVLLMLDTESGSPAEDAYRRLGWIEYGRVADHAARPDGVLSGSTFFARRLDGADPRGHREAASAHAWVGSQP
jgi:GNAT superfamily N-acetyltransferase